MSNVDSSISRGYYPNTRQYFFRGRLENAQWDEFSEKLWALANHYGLDCGVNLPQTFHPSAQKRKPGARKRNPGAKKR